MERLKDRENPLGSAVTTIFNISRQQLAAQSKCASRFAGDFEYSNAVTSPAGARSLNGFLGISKNVPTQRNVVVTEKKSRTSRRRTNTPWPLSKFSQWRDTNTKCNNRLLFLPISRRPQEVDCLTSAEIDRSSRLRNSTSDWLHFCSLPTKTNLFETICIFGREQWIIHRLN